MKSNPRPSGGNVPAYRAPRRWVRLGKYLLPLGMPSALRKPSPPPAQQVRLAQMASTFPEQVTLLTAGRAEALAEYSYECHSAGQHETHRLAPHFISPAYVGQISDGLSYGRHCCVIGPENLAVRETGFNLDGQVLSSRRPVSRWRPHYWRKRWEGDVTSRPWLPARQRLEGRVAVLNTRFSHNFYHWLIDILPRLAPLGRLGLEADYYLVDCLRPFQQDVFRSLGIAPQQLIQPHCRLLLEAEQLLVPSLPTPGCLREFGRMLSAALGVDRHRGGLRRIYISRRKTGTRTLTNEVELEQMLRQHGFETHAMEEYPLARQARLIREAEIVAGTHGAGLANLLFALPDTRVIEIVPAGRYNATCYPEKSRVFGLHHQLIFAHRARHKQILTVSLDDVEVALARAEQGTYRAAA